MRLVIVGGGIAAQSLAERVRGRDRAARITILSAEPRAPFDRVRLSRLLAGADEDSLRLRPDTWYEDNAVDLRTCAPVVAIHRREREAEVAGGERVPYDVLALCTGSSALVPPIPGIDKERSFVFRSPEDCRAIVDAAGPGTRAAVIGGGLLGLEAARGLVDRGAAVTVVHLERNLMERQVDGAAGAILARRMGELDVEVLLGRRTEEVLGNGRVTGLRFAGGEQIDCDLLVTCAGIRANVSLAAEAGLAVERGVLVDDAMRTDDPVVYAVGECAQHRGVVYGLVAPIHEQAEVAARAICGEPSAYEGSIPSATLKVMGVDLVAAGDPLAPEGCTVCDERAGVYRKIAVRDGVAVGAILMGDVRGSDSLVSMVRSRAPVPDPLGALSEAAAATVADLPDDAQICGCNGVCKGQIVQAIRDGGLTATREVCSVTRAGTGCGGCRDLVTELLRQETGDTAEEPTYLCACRRLTREQVAGTVRAGGLRSASEVMAACGAGRDCAACKPGVAYLVEMINQNRHEEERHARFINDRVHANIQNDGTFSVVPRIRGGVTSPQELRRIADVAERHGVRMVKITGGQRIDLLGVPKERLVDMWRELDMPSGFAYSKAIRTVKTCVGAEFCRFGIGDSIALGVEMESVMEGLRTPHKVKLGVSGCPRNCAEATVKDIGVVAVEGGWQVLVGGAAGSRVRQADVLDTVPRAEDALRLAITFLQYYREQAEYLERTYDFVERVGLDAIRSVVLDEAGGAPAELRERFAIARAAVSDPWADAVRGAQPHGDFRDLGVDPEPALVGPPPDALLPEPLECP
ncbi:MAG: nitrite reductase large subunit NirB [Thermoleophilia bacterium]